MVGALSHAMLPSQEIESQFDVNKQDTKYVDIAIGIMLDKLLKFGANKSNLQAKLVGGANMYPNAKTKIGDNNIAGAKKKLMQEGIPLIGECVGGSQGRSIEFSIVSGIVTVKTKF